MLDDFSNFMVFQLKDSGERERLYITEPEFSQDNGSRFLHDSQVLIIVKENIRRIFIWKGYQSTVRKKFIASRVANDLQQELTNLANFHRCKIVSIDQGEEPFEFLNTFGIKSYDVPEKPKVKIPQISASSSHKKEPKAASINYYRNQTYSKLKSSKQKLYKSQIELLDKILQYDLPKGYKRNHILLGDNDLYGIVVKKTEILGKKIEESKWEQYKKLPKEVIELNGHKLRIHFNKDLNTIEAIEVLEKLSIEKKEEESESKIDYNKWTVKQLKAYCAKNNIKVPSSYRKAQIVNLVEEFNES